MLAITRTSFRPSQIVIIITIFFNITCCHLPLHMHGMTRQGFLYSEIMYLYQCLVLLHKSHRESDTYTWTFSYIINIWSSICYIMLVFLYSFQLLKFTKYVYIHSFTFDRHMECFQYGMLWVKLLWIFLYNSYTSIL